MSETMVNWLSHSIGMLLVLAFSLPSFVLIWMAKKIAIHQQLIPSEVQAVEHVKGDDVEPYSAEKLEKVIEEFNQDIFIQKVAPTEIKKGPHLRIKTVREVISIYPKDRNDMYVERVNKKGKTTVYWVRSASLAQELTPSAQPSFQ